MKIFSDKKARKMMDAIMEDRFGVVATLCWDGTANVEYKGKVLPAAYFMVFVEQDLYVFAGGKVMTTVDEGFGSIWFLFSKTQLLVPSLCKGSTFELITEEYLASSDLEFAAAFVVSGMSVFVMASGALSGELVYYIQKDWDHFDTALDLFRQSTLAFSPEKAQKLEHFLKTLEQEKGEIDNEKEE